MSAYPDEQSWWPAFDRDLEALYVGAPQPQPYPGDATSLTWGRRTAYDIGAGVPAEQAKAKHLAECQRELGYPAPPVPALLPARIEQGRYRTDAGWFVPRFYTALDAVWLVKTGQRNELIRRFDRAQEARCNGVRVAGMLDWRRPDDIPYICFSPFDSGYWEALDTVVSDAARVGCYTETAFFCDAQRIVPSRLDRIRLTQEAAQFASGHPTFWMQMANEAFKNGWAEADDPDLLMLAQLFKAEAPDTLLSVSDPRDGDTEGGTADYNARQAGIRPIADYLVVHPSRKEDPGRWARWVDHLKGFAGSGTLLDEPMGAASTRQPGRRDNRVTAHVAAAYVGAMVGGYTYMHRTDEDDTTPGLLASAGAADIPGTPDTRFVNATLAESPVAAFSGFEKCRTCFNPREAWAVAYGPQNGSVQWRDGWSVAVAMHLEDADGAVTVWRATR